MTLISTSTKRILIIIPAYNEEDTITSVIKEIREKIAHADICVVNDGSSDSTAHVVSRLGVHAVNLPFNMGIGAAVQTGFLYAKINDYDYAIQVDADGQHNISYINALITLLDNDSLDIVSGSRFLERSGYRSSFLRRIGILWFELMNKIITGQRITDSTSGFRLYNRRAIAFFSKNYPEDYPEPEVIIVAKKAGFCVREIPVTMRERQGGESSIKGWKVVHYMIKVVLSMIMQSLKGE
ncbi:MAG: glycosyltransferase family 2 protein [candidate division WOR-3 bacterium]|nr:MAG: glycosyltransferase family 2 protein [candidate division WOR-3 bacterium]